MEVKIAGVLHESVTDGPGVRSVIFFQGCPHACPGCHNPHTWNMNGGEELDTDKLISTFHITPLLSGFTFSGGEPFAQAPAAAQLAEYVKSCQKDLWVYTGYVWEQLLADIEKPGYRALIHMADVIVDGPFKMKLRDLSLPYRGSSNQRILLPQQSLDQNRVISWGEEHSGVAAYNQRQSRDE